MNVAIVSNPDAVNSHYRALVPLSELQRRGHRIAYSRPREPLYPMDVLLRCDAVLIHRYTDAETRRVIERLRGAGVGIVWDNDDDLANVPRSNPHYSRFGGLNRQRIVAELAKTQSLADVVTTPSAVLAESYRVAGATDVRILENYLPPEFERVGPASGGSGVTIAYLAGLEHQVDYQTLGLRGVLGRLLERHSDLRVLSVGLGLGLPADRYEHIPLAEFLDLASILSAADIGIAPLTDIPWNRARSNVKLKEYGISGLAWLASPVGAYSDLGDRQGGRLVTDDGWFDALDELIRNRRLRRRLAKRARRWALRETMARHVDLWEQAFGDAARRAQLSVAVS